MRIQLTEAAGDAQETSVSGFRNVNGKPDTYLEQVPLECETQFMSALVLHSFCAPIEEPRSRRSGTVAFPAVRVAAALTLRCVA